ncbi:MAG: T9SS type A sorting domain-containing protein [Candidatus Eisenbacteria bacterium]
MPGGEDDVRRSGRGAVAAIASTAYEWLSANAWFQEAVTRSWFDPPLDDEGHASFFLGDLIDGGKLELQRIATQRNQPDYGIAQSGTYVLLGDPTMPVDFAPPRVSRVEVNGEPWTTGTPLVAAESDSALIEVWLRDETWVQSVVVLEGGTEIDPSRYQVVQDPEHPEDSRFAILRYRAPIDVPLADYQVEVRGQDRNGRNRTVAFPVTLSSVFEIRRPEGWIALRSGDFISVGDSVRVTMDSPVPREATDFGLFLEDTELSGNPEPMDVDGRVWRLRGEIPFVKSSGTAALNARVVRRDGTGTARREVAVQGSAGSGEVDLTDVYNFPNPFTDETRFFYFLNGLGRSAHVQVYTLRGQRIFEADGTARAGENAITWDGRDLDGDPVANGVYFYKLEVDAGDGRKLSRIERLARVR